MAKAKNILVWNGKEFSHVTKTKANSLVKKDKAQIVDPGVSGVTLKKLDQFSGYKKTYKNKIMTTTTEAGNEF